MEQGNKETQISTEVSKPFDLSMAAIADTNIEAIAEQAEKRIAAYNTIWRASLEETNAYDWVDQGGKPYLQASGAQKIARLLGVSWRVNAPTEEDLGGGHYLIKYTGEFALGGAIISALGTRSSKDPFFSRSKGRDLPASDVDKGNVTKAAHTNLLVNGITQLLGLRNLTWEVLAEYAKIKKADVSSVGYKGKAEDQGIRGKTEQKERAEPPANGDPATEAQCRMLHAILSDRLGITDELAKHQKVATVLGLGTVPTSMSKLTKLQASTAIEALQKEANGGKEATE